MRALVRLLASCLMLLSLPALANDRWGGSVGVTTDYRLRGVSQSDGSTAAQADVHYESALGWFAGVWASTVRLYRDEDQTVQLNGFAGLRWLVDDDWSAKLALSHYAHPWDAIARRYDYDDVTAGAAWRDRLFFNAAWSPNMSLITSTRGIRLNRSAFWYEASGRQPLIERLSAVAGVGYFDITELAGRGYWYGSAGVTYDLQNLHFDVSKVINSAAARDIFYGESAEDRWTATVVWTF